MIFYSLSEADWPLTIPALLTAEYTDVLIGLTAVKQTGNQIRINCNGSFADGTMPVDTMFYHRIAMRTSVDGTQPIGFRSRIYFCFELLSLFKYRTANRTNAGCARFPFRQRI